MPWFVYVRSPNFTKYSGIITKETFLVKFLQQSFAVQEIPDVG